MVTKSRTLALFYALVAMVFGVFYREFPKFSGFTGQTNLSGMHPHYFILGIFFFLILALLEKSFGFSAHKRTGGVVLAYNIGLNISGLGFLVRGLAPVWGTELSTGMDASISGVAGIGPIILGVCIGLLLLRVRRTAQ